MDRTSRPVTAERFFSLLVSLVFSAFIMLSAAMAQAPAPQNEEAAKTDQTIEGWRIELDQIASGLKRENIQDRVLTEFRDRAIEIRDEADALAETITPELQRLTNQLEQLKKAESATLVPPVSAAPAAPEPADKKEGEAKPEEKPAEEAPKQEPKPATEEKPELSQAEKTLQKQKSELENNVQILNAQLGRVQVVSLRAKDLIVEITDLKRSKFTNELFGRAPSVFAPAMWVEAVKDVEPLLNAVAATFMSGFNRVINSGLPIFLAALAGSISLIYLILTRVGFLRLRASTNTERNGDTHEQMADGFDALKQVLRSLIMFMTVPGVVYVVLLQAGLMSERVSAMYWIVLVELFFFMLARALSLAIFAPGRPGARLFEVNDAAARRIHTTVVASLIVSFVGFTTVKVGQLLVASFDFITVTYGTMAVLFAFIGLSRLVQRIFRTDGTGAAMPNILAVRILAVFVIAALLVALVAPVVGYPFLGAFAVQQVVLACIIAGIIFISFSLIEAYLTSKTVEGAEGGVVTLSSANEKERRLMQVMLLISGAAKVALTLLGLVVFAATWGLDTRGIWTDLVRLFSEIKIGAITISPSTIVMAILLFAVGILVTRSLQRWMTTRFLPTTTLDTGLRNSITTGMGYIGFIASAMFAFSQAGLDLSNLAIVAGALSLGIGFGLQSIVSNFVSGIILLAERPIKAGDWIAVGGEEGTVKKISVRSTEIETFDRATVIMPNADFISGSVKNMMYGNTMGRFIVNIGVGYDSDPDKVKEILLDIAKSHPLVLAYPEPFVVFQDFGASSLDFELRGYLADCGTGLSTRSDIRFAIFKRFAEAGIEIPFPQRDLNVKGLPPGLFSDEMTGDEDGALDDDSPKPARSRRIKPSKPQRAEMDDIDDGE